ncbi:MAG: hypothetical protein IJ584_12305 [Bacteroidales bacterium]|nr:hypothetical protein [Bacteroidales bacterium]
MKTIDKIENLSLEELEKIAGDTSIKVPEDLSRSITEAIAAQKEMEKKKPALPFTVISSAAAAAAIAIAVAIPALRKNGIKDTYDDPMLAYAQVEETLKLISSKMSSSLEKAKEASGHMEKPSEIIDRINSDK